MAIYGGPQFGVQASVPATFGMRAMPGPYGRAYGGAGTSGPYLPTIMKGALGGAGVGRNANAWWRPWLSALSFMPWSPGLTGAGGVQYPGSQAAGPQGAGLQAAGPQAAGPQGSAIGGYPLNPAFYGPGWPATAVPPGTAPGTTGVGYAPPAGGGATGGGQAAAPSYVPAPGGVDPNWYRRFQESHNGLLPEEYYSGTPRDEITAGQGRSALGRALKDLQWSRGFQDMYGRAPTEDDWKSYWFRGYTPGAREQFRNIKGMTEHERRAAEERASTPEEARRIKEMSQWAGGKGWYQLWREGKLTGARYDQFLREKGMTPEAYFSGGGQYQGPIYQIGPGGIPQPWLQQEPTAPTPAPTLPPTPVPAPTGETWTPAPGTSYPGGAGPGFWNLPTGPTEAPAGATPWEAPGEATYNGNPRAPLFIPPRTYWRL